MTTETALTTSAPRDITVIRDDPRLRYEPTNWSEATKAAEALYRSGLLPSGIKSPQAAVALIVYGAERGLSLMQSLTSVYVVEGRPSMSAEMMVALVLASPQCEWFHLVESTRDRAVYECQRRGDPKPIQYAYTTEDAKDAGLLGRGTWQKHQRAMLRARASAGLCRIAFPDVTAGVYTPDEQEDVRESRRATNEGGAVEMPIVESAPVSARDAIIAEAKALQAGTEVVPEPEPEPEPTRRRPGAANLTAEQRAHVTDLRARLAEKIRRADETPESALQRATELGGRVTAATYAADVARIEGLAAREPGQEG